MKDSVMVRQGHDSFDAVMIADAMQSCRDTDVISVVFCGKEWHVFAAFDSSMITIDAIDYAIARHTKGGLSD